MTDIHHILHSLSEGEQRRQGLPRPVPEWNTENESHARLQALTRPAVALLSQLPRESTAPATMINPTGATLSKELAG